MVREATEADLPFIVELGREAHERSCWAPLAAFDPESFEASCRMLMERETAVVLVADRGSIWMVRHKLYFNHAEAFVQDVFWYATKNGDALRRAAERWAGPGLCALSRNDGTDPRLEKLLHRARYAPVEHQFARRLT
jgi:hypothetical protein